MLDSNKNSFVVTVLISEWYYQRSNDISMAYPIEKQASWKGSGRGRGRERGKESGREGERVGEAIHDNYG